MCVLTYGGSSLVMVASWLTVCSFHCFRFVLFRFCGVWVVRLLLPLLCPTRNRFGWQVTLYSLYRDHNGRGGGLITDEHKVRPLSNKP